MSASSVPWVIVIVLPLLRCDSGRRATVGKVGRSAPSDSVDRAPKVTGAPAQGEGGAAMSSSVFIEHIVKSFSRHNRVDEADHCFLYIPDYTYLDSEVHGQIFRD